MGPIKYIKWGDGHFGRAMEEKGKESNAKSWERDRTQDLEDIREIFIDVLSIEVNEKVPSIDQLIDIVHKFNEDTNGQEKLLIKAERKFENKVLKNVEQKIAIDQVELSTLIFTLETIVNIIVSFL